jgi:hypothetical protein
MMFYVEFPSLKRPGTLCSTGYDTLSEAVTVCRVHRDQGKHPLIRCADFRALPFCANKWADKPRLQWSMSFTPVGCYKGVACRRGEAAGVRYLSHRRGYVASDSAFRRFCASWAEYLAWCEANADIISANREAA